MGHFRALRPLQSSAFGLKAAGEDFHWEGSIIGWHVEPLDDDAKRMVEERAKVLKQRGEKGPGGEDEKPLPTQPFPQSVMRASAGMTAPGIVGGTLSASLDTPAPDANAPQMSAPPRRRKAS